MVSVSQHEPPEPRQPSIRWRRLNGSCDKQCLLHVPDEGAVGLARRARGAGIGEPTVALAPEANERPRKTLGWSRPIDLFNTALALA
jgi:hypothetical protein